MKNTRQETDRRSWLAMCLLALAVPFVLSSGCYYCNDDDDFDDDNGCYRDDDDFDDDFDDDDFDSAAQITRDGSHPFRLLKFLPVASKLDGRHPVAEYRAIEGVALPAGTTEWTQASFELFATQVLRHNPELFSLPGDAGELFFLALDYLDTGYRVRFEQGVSSSEERASKPEYTPVPDTAVVFHFDLVGRLERVENRTWIRLPQ